jgi:hypothetical protein
MKKYIVVDKQEGFSFICDGPFEVIEGVGCEDHTWDEMLVICKDTYEIIEYTGNIKYILD